MYVLAAVKSTEIGEIKLEQKEIPHIAENEVLVKVEFCGVCGSDLHAYTHSKGYEFVPYPIVLGHEIVGTVHSVGNPSLSYLEEKKVCVESMHYCDECKNCLQGRKSICENNKVIGLHYDGGMAQYVKTKAKYIKLIPDDISPEIAVLSEPLANAVHAVKRVNDLQEGDVVHVQGPGIIGFFIGLVCIEMGAKVYISGLEKDYESRLKKAGNFGMIPNIAEQGLPPEEFDVVFECSGANRAFENCFKQLRKGGKIVVIAMYEETSNLFLTNLNRNEWPILTTYGCDPKDYDLTFSILNKYGDRLKEVTSYYPIEKTKEAFQAGLEKKVLKPILEMN